MQGSGYDMSVSHAVYIYIYMFGNLLEIKDIYMGILKNLKMNKRVKTEIFGLGLNVNLIEMLMDPCV